MVRIALFRLSRLTRAFAEICAELLIACLCPVLDGEHFQQVVQYYEHIGQIAS
jgi:hypothetical protein